MIVVFRNVYLIVLSVISLFSLCFSRSLSFSLPPPHTHTKLTPCVAEMTIWTFDLSPLLPECTASPVYALLGTETRDSSMLHTQCPLNYLLRRVYFLFGERFYEYLWVETTCQCYKSSSLSFSFEIGSLI